MSLRRLIRLWGPRLGLVAAVWQIALPAWAFVRIGEAWEAGALCVAHEETAPAPASPGAPGHEACPLCAACAMAAFFIAPEAPVLPPPNRPVSRALWASTPCPPHGQALVEARARAPPSLS